MADLVYISDERILYPLDIFEKEEGVKRMKQEAIMTPAKKEGKGRMMGGGGKTHL